MAGNSSRRGAIRKGKKGALAGSGGQGARALRGKGPTPRAEERTGHPASRRAAAAAKRTDTGRPRTGRAPAEAAELLVGRNPVLEALRARIPATALYLALGQDSDERVSESIQLASGRDITLLEVGRGELDRRTGGLIHQGIALQVPPYVYADLPDLLARVAESPEPPLLVALDGVLDPRNLGAIVRSAVAFGAQGVIVPERRAAGMTAAAWRTSAGTAARIPIARVTNLTRALKECAKAGLFVVGLDADGSTPLDELSVAGDGLVVVVGSEGRGLSRLVGEACDLTVAIPMHTEAESLNASVAAAVTLAEVARIRRRGR